MRGYDLDPSQRLAVLIDADNVSPRALRWAVRSRGGHL